MTILGKLKHAIEDAHIAAKNAVAWDKMGCSEGESDLDTHLEMLESAVKDLKQLKEHECDWDVHDNGACICTICGADGNS
jgi:hypothetical protein